MGPLLLGDLRSLVDAYTRLDQNYAMLGKAIEEELDAIIETSQQESTHHCQDVVSCIVSLNHELLQTYCENHHLFCNVRETIMHWTSDPIEKQKGILRIHHVNSAPIPQVSFAVSCLWAISRALVQAQPFVLNDVHSQKLSPLRALESTMIILYQCTEVIEWCYQQSVWQCWVGKDADQKTLCSRIQNKYQQRAQKRKQQVGLFKQKVQQAFHIPNAKRTARVEASWVERHESAESRDFVDRLVNWLVPDTEQHLLVNQLSCWPSKAQAPEDGDKLFKLVCGQFFCLENREAEEKDAVLQLDSKHAALRYLLYDVHHFTPETETSVNMMVSHREVFEKMGERPSVCYYYLDEVFSDDQQPENFEIPIPPQQNHQRSRPLGCQSKNKLLHCAELIRFEEFAATRDASALEGGLSDYLLHEARNEKRERHAKGVDMKHDPATVLRKLANSLEANGQIKESAECQLLADKYDALNQVDRVWTLIRTLYYAGASAQVVASVLPRPSSVLSVSLQPADVLIAVMVLCNAGRVADALSWVRLVRTSKILSSSREDALKAAMQGLPAPAPSVSPAWKGDSEDAGTLLGQIAMQMICQWCWSAPELEKQAVQEAEANAQQLRSQTNGPEEAQKLYAADRDAEAARQALTKATNAMPGFRKRRLGMLMRTLRPAETLVAANSSQLSWEERTVVHFLTTVAEDGCEEMRQLGQDLAIVALFQRNKLGQLLERQEDHHENKAKADSRGMMNRKTGVAADAIMDNLVLVVPELQQQCIKTDLKHMHQAPKAWKVAATMGVEENEVPRAMERVPMSVSKQAPAAAATIGSSPFVTALPNRPPVSTATPMASRPAMLPVPAFGAPGTPSAFAASPAPAVPSAVPLAHNSLLVALETPPPNSSFPRPDSSRAAVSTPMTPAFFGNSIVAPSPNHDFGKSPAPQPSPASGRRALTSRVVIKGRGSAQGSLGRASIQPTRKREAAVPNFEESMPIDDGNNGEMFAPDPVPMDVGTQYIPAQGQAGKLSDPLGTPVQGDLTINMPPTGLASARQGLRSSARPAGQGTPLLQHRGLSRRGGTPDVSSFKQGMSRTPAGEFADGQNAPGLSPMPLFAPLATPDLTFPSPRPL